MSAISPPMEDYLEAIFELCRDLGVARIKDIASRMKVTNPSVVGAIRMLKRKGLVSQERYGFVRLTAPGEAIARSVLQRHHLLADFLENILGLAPENASADACKIEHAVSPEAAQRLNAVSAFLRSRAHGDLNWSKEFNAFFKKYRQQERP